MRALQFSGYGSPEVLAWADAPVPHVGPGEIRLAVRAASRRGSLWGSAGDEVFGLGQSTQAECAVLNAWSVKPPSIDWAVAAAAGVAGETSERALRLLGVKAGDTIFIGGGAGGVGSGRRADGGRPGGERDRLLERGQP